MKKIIALLLSSFLINQLTAQNNTIDGSLYGMDKDVYIINYDRNTNVDAGIRLTTLYAGYKSWNIFNEREDGKLHFSFSQSSSHNDVGSRKMTLNFSGQLGIGTTTPNNKLDVSGGIDINDYIRHNGDENTYFGFGGNDQFRIRTNNADRLFINSSGNIGIGTTSPSYKLHAKGDIYADGGWMRVSGQRGIYFQSYGGGLYMTDATWIRTYGNKSFYHNTGTMRTDGTFQVGNGGSRFLVKTDGKVGIGTTAPSYPLHVKKTHSSSWQSRFENGSSNVYLAHSSGYGMHINTGGTNSSSRYALEVRNSNQTHFYVRDDGKVGVGTTSPTAKLHLRGSRADFYIQNTSATNWAFMRIQGSGSNFWDIGQYGDNDYLEFRPKGASNDNRVVIKQSGHVGIGTTSPDEKLSVIGKLSLANTADETIDYIRLYHDGEANVSTEEGALHFRKGNEKYLVAEQLANTAVTRIHSYGQPLVLRGRALPDVPDPADPLGDLTIKDDGTVVIHNGFELEGNFNLTNTELGNEDEYVLSLGAGDEIRRRSVESLTPWVIRQVYQEADTVDVLSCSPHAEGEECGCPEGAHVTIDASDVIDIEGNLAIGDQGFIDNDQVAGPNLDEGTGEKTVNDDYIRIQESIEFSSSSTTRGLVLLDNAVGSGKFLNFFHNDGISYFSNSTNSTPDADYFMKAGTGVPAEKNQITFADRVTFNNGFVTSSYTSPNAMNFAMDTDNTGEDAIFKVGRGTQDVNDETNWFGLFYVDKDGVATFSSDIGDSSNPNRITLNGSTGSGTFSSDLTVEGVSNLSGNLNVGGSSVFSLSADFLQDANITGNLNVLGSSNILTGSYGSAVDWKTAYDSRVNANQGLVWDPISKNLDVKLGDGLHLNGSGEIESDFVQDGPDKISYHGSLAIGTTKHSTFALSVAGEVGAEEVTIQNEGEWPDYVFEAGYELESLEETAAFIAKNKHLPEVPSSQEVSENGIKVGQMNAILLKKIEELTLHLIAKDKEIASLREENKRIDDIEERLLQLENK
ncbi:shufflon system plasmid conjugative transfer pilus tip adhesin PilV [Reichenbachiella sp.]|uniref:shufflon system plasmid conjugative transfer pilus tip adhesin PilV n=1 Tax=Reichenbachiella sp. TaxID=2184521 RepID=UPI003BAFDDAA